MGCIADCNYLFRAIMIEVSNFFGGIPVSLSSAGYEMPYVVTFVLCGWQWLTQHQA